jgi:hypothetical protein
LFTLFSLFSFFFVRIRIRFYQYTRLSIYAFIKILFYQSTLSSKYAECTLLSKYAYINVRFYQITYLSNHAFIELRSHQNKLSSKYAFIEIRFYQNNHGASESNRCQTLGGKHWCPALYSLITMPRFHYFSGLIVCRCEPQWRFTEVRNVPRPGGDSSWSSGGCGDGGTPLVPSTSVMKGLLANSSVPGGPWPVSNDLFVL